MRHFYVHTVLDRCLSVSHDKAHLLHALAKIDCKDDHEANGKPCYNRCVTFKAVHAKGLLAFMNVDTSLILCDLIGSDVLFVSYGPDWGDYCFTFRYLGARYHLPVLVSNMLVNILCDCFTKLVYICLFHRLTIIHDVTDHLSMECRMLHPLLLV